MIKLINADCMDVMPNYPDNYFDLALVDPPYMNNIDEYMGMQKRLGGKAKNKVYNNIQSFSKPGASYFCELERVSKNQVVWGCNHFDNMGSGRIIWDKDNTGQFNDCELAYQSLTKSVRIFRHRWNGMLQQDMKNKEIRIHPTQKPVQLYKWILKNYSEKGQKILDTHLGSGSSAIASHYFGAGEFVGIEIDKEYFDKATKRIEDQTKQLTIF